MGINTISAVEAKRIMLDDSDQIARLLKRAFDQIRFTAEAGRGNTSLFLPERYVNRIKGVLLEKGFIVDQQNLVELKVSW